MSVPHALQNLKSLRLSKGLSREVMAASIGVKPTSYDRFENGTRRLYFDKAIALAKTLGVSLDELHRDPGTDEHDTGTVVAALGEWDGLDDVPA